MQVSSARLITDVELDYCMEDLRGVCLKEETVTNWVNAWAELLIYSVLYLKNGRLDLEDPMFVVSDM